MPSTCRPSRVPCSTPSHTWPARAWRHHKPDQVPEAAESVDISGAEGEADDVDDDARSNISNIINDEPEESEESADGVESENCCSIYTKNRGGGTLAHDGARWRTIVLPAIM